MGRRGRGTLLVLVALLACRGDPASSGPGLEEILATDWSALDHRVVTRMPDGAHGGTLVVLLHGYGSSGDDHVPFAQALLDDRTRVVLPTAVLPHASGRGAMWWEFLENDWPKPYPVHPDAESIPEASRQLPPAREAVLALVSRVRERFRPDTLVMAGHSQGAMLALDVSARLEPPPDRIVSIAGYVLLDSVAAIRAPRPARPDVLVSQGRSDEIVWFQAAEEMRTLLVENGYAVAFRPHDGGHGIDARVVRDVRTFLRTP